MKEYIDSDCKFAVRGLDIEGNARYYTGRAGDGWVSPSADDAFLFYAQDVARKKALLFNRMAEIHGLRFVAIEQQ